MKAGNFDVSSNSNPFCVWECMWHLLILNIIFFVSFLRNHGHCIIQIKYIDFFIEHVKIKVLLNVEVKFPKNKWKHNFSFKKTLFIVSSGEIKLPEQLQSTCDENQFQKDLVGPRQRTSSPIDFRSLIRNSVLLDTTAFQDCPNDPLPDLRG